MSIFVVGFFSPSGAEAGLFQEYQVNALTANAFAHV